MSMQLLNQLVARSIVDPTVLQAFSEGTLDEVIHGMGFAPEMSAELTQIEANTWVEYAVCAYRLVKATEKPAVRIDLPSPLTGLLPEERQAGEERAA